MAAGSTYTPIATYTLPSAATSYTFSIIPSTYTDLRIVMVTTPVAASSIAMTVQFNGDTGSNYSFTRLIGNGSTATSSRGTAQTQAYVGITGDSLGMATADIMNYSNTTTYKTLLGRAGNAAVSTTAYVSIWLTTSAINSILIKAANGASIAAGSTFTLYGIAKA